MYYHQQGLRGAQGLLNQYAPKQGFLNNNNQLRTSMNFPPPYASAVPPVPPGSGNTPTQNVPYYNPSNHQNISNKPAWLNTYYCPYSVRVDVDSRTVTFREEDANNKTSMYVYTSHLLSTPFHVPVRQMPLDLYNGLPGVVLQIGKTKNHDTISFFALVDTCAAIKMGTLLLKIYIMTKHPYLVTEFIQYNDTDPFDPIVLQCTVADLVKTENDHGI